MELRDLRGQIDAVDDELVRLFTKRMELSAQVADYKKAHDLPIHVPARESEILQNIANKTDPEFESYARVLYSTIFELSRRYQRERNSSESQL